MPNLKNEYKLKAKLEMNKNLIAQEYQRTRDEVLTLMMNMILLTFTTWAKTMDGISSEVDKSMARQIMLMYK